VYKTLRDAQKEFPGMQILRSNHQDKLERWLKHNPVQVMPELQRTINEFALGEVSATGLLEWLEAMPYGFCFRDAAGKEYRCAHAFFPSWLDVLPYEQSVAIYDVPKKARQLMMYGPSHTDRKGRIFWWLNSNERNWVRVAGHYHVVHVDDQSIVIDAGMGGEKRSWFCNEPAALCIYDTVQRKLVEVR
jgi:diadenosine tetraphosphatase ApaH/serine/threonine PP2A family protein phosphatase